MKELAELIKITEERFEIVFVVFDKLVSEDPKPGKQVGFIKSFVRGKEWIAMKFYPDRMRERRKSLDMYREELAAKASLSYNAT